MRVITAAFAIAAGVIILLGYFFQVEQLDLLRLRLIDWAILIAAMAVLVGIYNLAAVQLEKIRARQKGSIYGVVMLLSLAGLSAVPKHLYEAAAIDRASRSYTFFRITLPLVAPILMIAIIFRTMEAFKTFDLAYILASQPTTEVISIRLYKMAFQEWQTGMSSALAYIVLVMVLAITNIYIKYLNKVKER